MTSPLLFSNNATTTLGSTLSSGATSVTVATGAGVLFPNPGVGQYFHATMWTAGSTTGVPNEIVLVTSRSGDTMTIVRAQEGTVAGSWNIGDTFANYVTSGDFATFAQQADVQAQAGNFADDTGSANNGVITLSPAPASWANMVGVPVRVLKINAPNSGAYTVNPNGLGGKPVVLPAATSLTGGELPGDAIYTFIYDGTNCQLQSTPAVLQPDSVTNTELATMPAMTVKLNPTGSTAGPQDAGIETFLASFLEQTGALGSQELAFTLPVSIGGVATNVQIRLGNYVSTFTGEGLASVPLVNDFTTECLGCFGIGINNSGSNLQDLWVQVDTNALSTTHLPFYLQGISPAGGTHIDGIAYVAWGK